MKLLTNFFSSAATKFPIITIIVILGITGFFGYMTTQAEELDTGFGGEIDTPEIEAQGKLSDYFGGSGTQSVLQLVFEGDDVLTVEGYETYTAAVEVIKSSELFQYLVNDPNQGLVQGFFAPIDVAKAFNPMLDVSSLTKGFYILDPVLGDNGRIYVDNKLVTAMRDNLLPLANFVTPNQFELELLSGQTVGNVPSADKAAQNLLEQYPNLNGVLVTGVNHINNSIHDRFISQNDVIDMAFKKRTRGIAGGGDLLTTIFASWLASGHSFKSSFKAASEQAHAIIDRSDNHLEIKLLENINLFKVKTLESGEGFI